MRERGPRTVWMADYCEPGRVVHMEEDDVAVPMVVVGCRKYEGRLKERKPGWITDIRELTEEEWLALRVMES